ncbi:rho guanine nucleotide exchange factor 4-like [Hypanus sabinus]|uniref:rho guanine nucleotide exchange factor 4-like n=1 Tax=Hypanus sabinus TaxID=79690 RepID=UPI0028C46E26|nr:rho guanine nucleotide exchange factor 4-like [Hypanus sabinus]
MVSKAPNIRTPKAAKQTKPGLCFYHVRFGAQNSSTKKTCSCPQLRWYTGNHYECQYRQSEPSDKANEESNENYAKPENPVPEQSSSKNNVLITEMLASLSILEEAEASLFEKHPINQSYHAKVFAGLSDILEGYYRECQKAKDLFSHKRLVSLFSNIGDIYKMHKRLLSSMERRYNPQQPHLSEFGACFIEQKKGFMMYVTYCTSHMKALEEWTKLTMVEKYAHFFEVCRMHQQMINLPLDGLLIMPVQKICKYPLLLKELLKVTQPSHPDYSNVKEAVVAMREVLDAINAEKGEDQEDKLTKFQKSVLNWKGEDLKLRSTELIHRGDLVVVSEPGARAKNYMAYLFDHQMILCKKDLIRRNVLYYKERIFLETCLVTEVGDGNDMEFDCKVKYAFKLRSKFFEERCRLMFAKSLADKQLWLHAFEKERNIASGNKVPDKRTDVDLGLEDSFYDLRSPNVSTGPQEQFAFLFQRKHRKSGYKFNPKIL